MTEERLCREMPTRRCPLIYGDGGCGERPCARFESEDPSVWAAEVASARFRLLGVSRDTERHPRRDDGRYAQGGGAR